MTMTDSRTEIKLGIAFFGGCGVNNARLLTRALNPASHAHLHLFVANTDANQLRCHFGSGSEDRDLSAWRDSGRLTIEQLGPELTKGMGAGGDPEIGRRATQDSMDKISAFLDKLDALILVGGLGGGSGTGALPLVAEEAKRRELPSLAVITMPFGVEGRTVKANEARERILDLVTTITVYNENLPDKRTRLSEAWRQINSGCLEPILLVLRESIQEVGREINTDLNDWKSALASGNYAFFGRYLAGESPKAPSEIARELVTNAFQDSKIVDKSGVLLFWVHGPWDLQEYLEVIREVKEQICATGRNPETIESHCNVHEADDSRWIALVAVAKEPPELQPSVTVKRAAEARPPAAAEQPAESPEQNLEPLTCMVNGLPRQVMISPRIARRWREVTSISNPDLPEVLNLQKTIEAETGVTPDLPRRLAIFTTTETASAGR